MANLRVLLLSDGRPGHYHLSQGVIAALERLGPVGVTRIEVRRRRLVPSRVLTALARPGARPGRLLALGYGLDSDALPEADIVVSAGGDTIFANVAVARLTGARNFFCGTLRKVPPEAFSLIISSYERHAGLARHIVALKPNAMDPDRLGRAGEIPLHGPANPPARAALLVGGNSGLFRYSQAEWQSLAAFVRKTHRVLGTRWLITTSRRTSDHAGNVFAELARDTSIVERFIDYRATGPGKLAEIFGRVDVALCTEDSSTMISEAVCARLAVVGVAPETHAFKPEEAEYRQFMAANDWCRFMAVSN